MAPLMRAFINMPRAPEKYDQRDQAELRRALAQALDSVTNVTSNQSLALTGDVTGSGAASIIATIADDSVTYAKMQNVSAASRVLGRGSAGGAGNVEELTLGSGLLLTGTVLSATATGDVVGPASATDHAIARFDLTTGKLLQNSAVTIGDSGQVDIAAGSANFPFVVTTTGTGQALFRYDSSNYLNVSVTSTGLVTMNAIGTAPSISFPDRIGLNSAATASAAVLVGRDTLTTGTSQRGLQFDWGASDGSTSTAISVMVNPNSSGLSGTWTTGNMYSVYLSNPVKATGQTVTTSTALFIAAQTAGGTNYSIWTDGAGLVRFGDVVNTTASYQVDGTKVVGNQGAAVADATDAATAITQLNALLARVRDHGLIAT